MKQPHKHAAVIKAWADGAKVQSKVSGSQWMDNDYPQWYENTQYRVKPEPKPDYVRYIGFENDRGDYQHFLADVYEVVTHWDCVIKLTFDGETNKLKKAEAL